MTVPTASAHLYSGSKRTLELIFLLNLFLSCLARTLDKDELTSCMCHWSSPVILADSEVKLVY